MGRAVLAPDFPTRQPTKEVMRNLTPVLFAASLAAALAQSAASLTIDNFEQGDFSVPDDTTTVGASYGEQSGLLSTNVIGGVRHELVVAGGTVGLATAALTTSANDDGAALSYAGVGGVGDFTFIYDGRAPGLSNPATGLLALDVTAFTHIQVDATSTLPVAANVEVQLWSNTNQTSSLIPLVVGSTLIPLSGFNTVNLSDIHAIRVSILGIDPAELPTITNISLIPVPEPASGLFLALGLVSLGLGRRRSR
jgi:PEP-CTERM motif-containing protein